MDESKEQNTQTLGQFSQVIFQFPKKSIQILLSISALSILVSCTPLFSHCISSNLYVQLFSYTTDRNCMFLFCNGILAFLITNSARAGTDANNNHQNIKQISVVDHHHQQSEPESAVEKRALPSEGVEEIKEEELGRENEDLAAADEDEFLTAEEDEFLTVEEEEEEEIGLLSKEELNKKCEDFIRKVREGIKIEAQTVDHGLVYDTKKAN